MRHGCNAALYSHVVCLSSWGLYLYIMDSLVCFQAVALSEDMVVFQVVHRHQGYRMIRMDVFHQCAPFQWRTGISGRMISPQAVKSWKLEQCWFTWIPCASPLCCIGSRVFRIDVCSRFESFTLYYQGVCFRHFSVLHAQTARPFC